MKNDMRIAYPLWQMVFTVLLMLIVYFSSELVEFGESSHSWYSSVFLWFIVIFIIITIIFTIKVVRHNRLNPDRKISIFTMKPQEYIEDDEWFIHVTRLATQKVYSFYVWIIPIFAGVMMGSSISKTGVIIGVLMMAFIQYFIFYRTIKNYVSEDE